ncbi:PIN domain-containing protein [Cyanobium sp. T1B-Tous]|uniref:type II toxin-antitoxin system VapC family toxin n=1 Tax=Cyanobium sp. T1B-Tous TaxID=2823721 RepID=UPI0020CC599A|nr:PIN domain-containing protein [Cyanobium sp. T1B-Tous]MCP9807132.1 PIN domain-containing protein [Cyanobium sp. T1B-Tous]
MIAFLDASALIYLVDGEARWAEATQATLHQLAVKATDLPLAVSRLSLLECRVAPVRRGDQSCLDRFEELFSQPDLLVVELSSSVVELATQLRANHGLRTPDAVMITGDAGFQRVQALQVRLIACA